MAERLTESQRESPESPKRRALHTLLKGLAFVPNLVFAALAGSLLAAPISLLLFRILPSHIAAYVQDVTTLLPAFGLGYLVARKFHHSVARWIWVPAIALWLLSSYPTWQAIPARPVACPDRNTFCTNSLSTSARIAMKDWLDLCTHCQHSANTLLHRLFAGREVRGAPPP